MVYQKEKPFKNWKGKIKIKGLLETGGLFHFLMLI